MTIDEFLQQMISERTSAKKETFDTCFGRIGLEKLANGFKKEFRAVLNNEPLPKKRVQKFINRSTAINIVERLLFESIEELLFGADWERDIYLPIVFELCLEELESQPDGKMLIESAITYYPQHLYNRTIVELNATLQKRYDIRLDFRSGQKTKDEEVKSWLYYKCEVAFRDSFDGMVRECKDFKAFRTEILIDKLKDILRQIEDDNQIQYLLFILRYFKETYLNVLNQMSVVLPNEQGEYGSQSFETIARDLFYNRLVDKEKTVSRYKIDEADYALLIAQRELIDAILENETERIRRQENDGTIVWSKGIYLDFCEKVVSRLSDQNINIYAPIKMDDRKEEFEVRTKAKEVYVAEAQTYDPRKVPDEAYRKPTNEEVAKMFGAEYVEA